MDNQLKDLVQDAVRKEMVKQNQGKQVAFSVSLVATGEDSFAPYERNTPLVFNHVVTNIGNAYSPVTGVFTAPLEGAYHFEWHIIVPGGRTTCAKLYKNTVPIFMATECQPSGAASASQGMTLQLKAEDGVSVRLQAGLEGSDYTQHLTTFSGHLIFTM